MPKPNLATVPANASNLDAARQRAAALIAATNASNPESGLIVRAVMACLVARANALMLGPPGVGKSRIARHICHALDGRFFEILMNRYTTPDEVFGPFSMLGIQQDAFRRVTTGRLPTADVVFLDEVFKANSAVLNTLLAVMNEHVFHDDGRALPIPVQLILAASNEVPPPGELDAMYDRFIVRLYKRDVEDDANMRAILARTLPAMSAKLALDDVLTRIGKLYGVARTTSLVVLSTKWDRRATPKL